MPQNTNEREMYGMLVSAEVARKAIETFPRRPPTGYDDRSWEAACRNHILLVAREMGEEPRDA